MDNPNQPTKTPEVQTHTSLPVNNSSNTKLPILILIGVAVTLIAIGAYILGTKHYQTINQQPNSTSPTPLLIDIQTPSPTESLPEKTLIKLTTPGKYNNEEYGYTVEFPEDWELYLQLSSKIVTIFHPQCKGEWFILPEKTDYCTHVSLPHYIGVTGWGYGNNRQVEEKIMLKNNISANKTTFYYDKHIEISWIFDKEIPKEKEHATLISFAIANEGFIPGSLETVNNIIKSLIFKN